MSDPHLDPTPPQAPILLDDGPDRSVTLEPAAPQARLIKVAREPGRLRRLGAGRRARAEFELIGELAERGLPLPRPVDCARAGAAWRLSFELDPVEPLSTWLRHTSEPAARAGALAGLAALIARMQAAAIAWPGLHPDAFGVPAAGAAAPPAAGSGSQLVLLGWQGLDARAGAPGAERRAAELAGVLGPLRGLTSAAERAAFTDAYLAELAPDIRTHLGSNWTAALRTAARRLAREQLDQRLRPEWPALPDFTLERSPHATTLRRGDLPGDYPKAVQRALEDRPRRSFNSPTGLSAQGAGNAIELAVDADGPRRVLILSGLAWDRTRARFFEALALHRLGLATTAPLALRSGTTPWACFALPLGYSDLALALAESDAAIRRAAPRALGRLLAELHDGGHALSTFRPRDVFISIERGDALFGPALPTRAFDPETETSDEARFGTVVGFLTAAEKTVTPGESKRFLAAYRATTRRLRDTAPAVVPTPSAPA